MSSPPDCNLACQTKIIINGDNIAALVEVVCQQAEYARDHDINLGLFGGEIIKLFNQMEDMACKAQALMLKAYGYTGPTGKMLQ